MVSQFSLATAESLYNSEEKFPVDFDSAWEWLGFSRKDSAKRALLDAGFIEGIEYTISFHNNVELGSLDVPRPKEVIRLALEAFKMWAMMAGTEQGKQVRLYFLECEKIAKHTRQQGMSFKEIDEYCDLAGKHLGADQKAKLFVEAIKKFHPHLPVVEPEIEPKQRGKKLKQLPPVTAEVEPLTPQFAVGRLVRTYAMTNNIPYQDCWNQLYTEFRDRYHIDLKKRGQNHKPRLTGVQYAVNCRQIENLYALAATLFETDEPLPLIPAGNPPTPIDSPERVEKFVERFQGEGWISARDVQRWWSPKPIVDCVNARIFLSKLVELGHAIDNGCPVQSKQYRVQI